MATTITKTVKSSGGDYSSLSGWDAGQQANIVTADEIQAAECYDFADTTPCAIDGWTTDATRYIRIYTPTAERHNGTPGTGYRLDSNGFANALNIVEDYVRVEGIAITAGSNAQDGIVTSGAGEVWISHCYLVAQNEPFQATGTGTVKVWNCMAKSNTDIAEYQVDAGTVYLYNCTAVSSAHDYGFAGGFYRSAGTAIAKNCLSDARSGTNCSSFVGTWAAGSTNNLSTDATAVGTNPQASKTPVFVDKAGGDFHLDPTDTDAKDQGTDLSADGNIAFSDDIDGDARSSWDIGADEITGGPPVITTLSPNSGPQGTVVPVTFTGSALDGANPVVTVSGSDVTASNINQVSGTSATADLTIAATAAKTTRQVTFETDDGESNAVNFVVVHPDPTRSTKPPVTLRGGTFRGGVFR